MARVFYGAFILLAFFSSYVHKLVALVPIFHSICRYVTELQRECSHCCSSTRPVLQQLCTYSWLGHCLGSLAYHIPELLYSKNNIIINISSWGVISNWKQNYSCLLAYQHMLEHLHSSESHCRIFLTQYRQDDSQHCRYTTPQLPQLCLQCTSPYRCQD